MSEKRCLACHSILTGEADCPVCGNPDYIVPSMNPEHLKKMQSWADDHRRSKLNAIEINVYGYSHEIQDNKLVQKSVEQVKLCDACELSFEKTFWLDQMFAPIITDETLQLTVVITKVGREIKRQELPFKAPALNELWHIGAYLTEGLGVGFVIGNEDVNVKTESVSLI